MSRILVVMPAKNAETTIEVAVRSTLFALPRDSELAIWDDGSTDGTLDAISRIKDPRITIFNSSTSVGGGVARSQIISRTDSEFVTNMDADDVCYPWRFRVQEVHVKKLDISFAATIRFGSNLSKLKPTNPINYHPSDSRISLAFHNTFAHPSMFAKREALHLAGGYRDLKVAQDYDLWLRAAAAGLSIGKIGFPCVGYRQSDVQVSGQSGYEERIRNQVLLRSAYLDLLDEISPGSKETLSSETVGLEDKEGLLQGILVEACGSFRAVLRPYYRRLVERQRFGPFYGSTFVEKLE